MRVAIQPKVAIVHDDLVQWGGAERVLLAISEVFPNAPIFTALYNKDNLLLEQKFANKKIITSFMQRIPFWKTLYKALLPLYPLAFEQFDFSNYDLVISHTTRFAKSIITKPETMHICYIHTPPRFLWNFSNEKLHISLGLILNFLRMYDQIASKRVDKYFSGSLNCARRVRKVYQAQSQVLYPFFDEGIFNSEVKIFNGGYFLIIARLNKFKKIDLAIDVFNKIGWNLKIIGDGPELNNLKLKANSNIEFLGSLSERMLKIVLGGCKALIITAEEDFGLTSLEAQALGKPVIAYKKGGVLETVIENKTGVFFKPQTPGSLIMALNKFERMKFNENDCKNNAKRFSQEIFKKNLKDLIERNLTGPITKAS